MAVSLREKGARDEPLAGVFLRVLPQRLPVRLVKRYIRICSLSKSSDTLTEVLMKIRTSFKLNIDQR